MDVFAPLSGVIVPLEDNPDPVFAQKLVGDGACIDPNARRMPGWLALLRSPGRSVGRLPRRDYP